MNALRWLKANNPLYGDVEIDDQWLEHAMEIDEELLTSIVKPLICTDCDESNLPGDDAFAVASIALQKLLQIMAL